MEGATAQAVLARRRDWGTAIFAACSLAIAVVAWPLRSVAPGIGSDWGWVSTLSYAAEHGLHFGSQLVWTYGPLGFLENWYGAVLYYGDTFTLAWLYAALVQLLLAATLLAALRRALPLPAAAALAAVVLALASGEALVLGFVWCALLILRAGDAGRTSTPLALPLALGVLTGIGVLGKLNQGVELVVLATVALVATSRRRDALAFAGALLLTAAIGWFGSGQRLADVWAYLRNGIQPLVGYAAAMGQPDARSWTIPVALLLAAVAVALAWDAGRTLPRRARWGLVAACLIYVGFNFKEGFVRQDTLHMLLFFGDLLALFAILLARAVRRPLVLAAMAGSMVAYAAVAGGHQFAEALNPYRNAKAVADQAQTLASSARQHRVVDDLRLRIQSFYRVAPELAAAVGRRPVMLWPYLYGEVAYAYGLRLQPLVGLEPYGTYTPRLDRIGAQALASERGPPRILRASMTAAPAIDGRFATFEAPLATLQIFCRYRHVASREPWELLVRARDRCGAPRPLRTVVARWGAPVPVPAPRRADALVLARIEGAGAHGLERLQELALRPARRWISLDGTPYRLIAATAPDGLLLSAPRGADYPQPFAMAANPRQIAVGRDGGEPGGTLRYAFVEVPLRRVAE